MERVGVMDCGAYSTKYAVVSRKSRHMSDVRVAEALRVSDAHALPGDGAATHWSQQLPPVVSTFAEEGASLSLVMLLDVQVPQHEKEKLLHLAFESVGCQTASLCYSAATSLFAAGQVSGVTVDIGYSGVRVTPVTRGVVETSEAFTSGAVGAAKVDEWLTTFLPSPSTYSPADLTTVKTHILAMDSALTEAGGEADGEATGQEEAEVKLPDGASVTLKVPPQVQRTAAQCLLRSERVSVPHAFRECCENVAIAKGEVYPWMLTGASCVVPHVRSALAEALTLSAICTDADESRAKNAAQAAVEGGVILSQLSTFKGMCITAETYADEGPQRCAHMKIVDYR